MRRPAQVDDVMTVQVASNGVGPTDARAYLRRREPVHGRVPATDAAQDPGPICAGSHR